MLSAMASKRQYFRDPYPTLSALSQIWAARPRHSAQISRDLSLQQGELLTVTVVSVISPWCECPCKRLEEAEVTASVLLFLGETAAGREAQEGAAVSGLAPRALASTAQAPQLLRRSKSRSSLILFSPSPLSRRFHHPAVPIFTLRGGSCA